MIIQFWPLEEIRKFKLKIDPLYKTHKWYLFMIGSPNKASSSEGEKK
jgi:hypothetical protein